LRKNEPLSPQNPNAWKLTPVNAYGRRENLLFIGLMPVTGISSNRVVPQAYSARAMVRTGFCLWFPVFIGLAIFPSSTRAQEDATAEFTFPVPIPIQCHGDAEYLGDEGVLIIKSREDERANVVYGDRSITADEVVVDQNVQQIRAQGDVRMWDNGRLMVADQVVYDLEKEEARLYNLRHSYIDPELYITGKEVIRQEVPGNIPRGATEPKMIDQYTILDGTVTTCDMPVPHYYIEYDTMTVLPGDRFWLYDIWWVQNGFPLGYLPYFTRSLARPRIAYIFGAASLGHLGFTTMHKLIVHLDPRLRLAFFGDTFSDVGYGYGASWNFHFPGEGGPDGRIRWYGVSQRDADDDDFFEDDDRYRLDGYYRQTLPYDITVRSRFHRSSDFEFNEDFDSVMEMRGVSSDELERDYPSDLSVSKSWDRQTIRVTGTKYLEDYFYSQLPRTERLPQARWDLMPSSFMDTRLYLDAHVAYDDARREQGYQPRHSAKDETNYIEEIQRTDAELRLFSPFDLAYGWYLQPYLGYRGTNYSDPVRRTRALANEEFDDEFRGMLETGTELGTRSIAYFDPGGSWGKMRFVFEPILGYDYFQPDTDLEEIGLDVDPRDRFPYIDDVDDFRATFHRISARVNTKLQRKAPDGTHTLARLTMGSAYDYFPDENLRFDNLSYINDKADSDDHRYTDYFEEFELAPVNWFALGNNLRYDIDDSTVRSSNVYVDVRPIARWSSRIGFNTFEDELIDVDSQEELYWNTQLKLSEKYSLRLGQRYDADESILRKSRLSIIRNLHDFQAIVELEHRNRLDRDEDYTIRFLLRFLGLGGKYNLL